MLSITSLFYLFFRFFYNYYEELMILVCEWLSFDVCNGFPALVEVGSFEEWEGMRMWFVVCGLQFAALVICFFCDEENVALFLCFGVLLFG